MIQIKDLWVDSASKGPGLRGVSLDVRAGEIVAVVGIEGNGQTELEEALAGLNQPRSGAVLVAGIPSSKARRLGGILGYVAGDREGTGLIPSLDIVDNLALAREGRPSRGWGFLDRPAQAFRAETLAGKFDVRHPGLRSLTGFLSGGNKQKLVLARELAPGPRALVACHPTRGLDAGASADVLGRLSLAREKQAAVLMITAEVDEALGLADRIFVMVRGLLREAPPGADRIVLGRMMLGENH